MSSAYNRPTRVNRSYRHPPTERLRNVNRPPRESRERVQFRRTVLRMFSCPFREESTCRNEATPFRCWFGHGVNRTDDDGDTANSNDNNTTTATTTQQVLSCNVPVETVLRPVPPYACIYSMMGFCDNETRTFENSSHQSPEIGCITGLHLTPEEFVDLDYFENKHSELIRNFYSEDHDLECSVCFDKVLRKRIPAKRRFGILEGCLHIFCSTCISEWRSRSFNCPVCRVYSSRVKFRARFVKTMEERKLMFPPVPSHFLPTPPVPLPPDLNLNLPDELPGADEMFVIRPYGYSSDDDYDEEGDSFYEDNPFGEPVQNLDPVIWNDDDRYDDDQFFERSGDEDSDYSYDYEDYRDFHENMFELLEFIENQAQPEQPQQLQESFSWTSPMSTNDVGGGSTNAGAGSNRGPNRGRRGRGRGRGARGGRGRGGRGFNSGTSQSWNEDGQAPAPAAANLSTSASVAPPVVLRSGYARIVNSPPPSSSSTTTTSASTTSPYELRLGYIQLERSSQPNSITSSSSNHRGSGYSNNNRSNRGYGGRGTYGDTRNQNVQNRYAYSNQPQPQASSSSSSEDWTSPSSDPHHHHTTQQTSSSRFWTTNDNSQQQQSSSQQPSQQQQRQNDRWHDDNNVNPSIINWTVDSDSEANNDNRQGQRGRGRGGWDYGYGGRGNNRRGNNRRGYNNNSRYNRRQFW